MTLLLEFSQTMATAEYDSYSNIFPIFLKVGNFYYDNGKPFIYGYCCNVLQ